MSIIKSVSRISNIHLKHYYPQTYDGLYMIEVGENGVLNKIVFTDGKYNKFSIEKVIVIDLDNETELANKIGDIYVRENIGIFTKNEESVTVYNREDAPNYKAFIKGASFVRENEDDIQYSYRERDGRGSSEEVRSSYRAAEQGDECLCG